MRAKETLKRASVVFKRGKSVFVSTRISDNLDGLFYIPRLLHCCSMLSVRFFRPAYFATITFGQKLREARNESTKHFCSHLSAIVLPMSNFWSLSFAHLRRLWRQSEQRHVRMEEPAVARRFRLHRCHFEKPADWRIRYEHCQECFRVIKTNQIESSTECRVNQTNTTTFLDLLCHN